MSKNDLKEAKLPETPEEWYKYWVEEFSYAEKFIKKWHTEGKKVVDAFLDERKLSDDEMGDASRKLNLFNSNIVTLTSMLYGRVPKVEVTRTFGDAQDDIARVACAMASRMLNQDIQDAGENHVSNLRAALQDRLLPGLGTVRLRYDFSYETQKVDPIMGRDGSVLAEGYEEDVISDEWVDEIYTYWKDILWSPCRTYSELRWKAFRSYMDIFELQKRFGKKKAAKIPLTVRGPTETNKGTDGMTEAKMQAEVWEIWSKTHKKVFWKVKGYDRVLDMEDDPLELDGFWPDPPPMVANLTTTKYLPRSDYKLAQDLYEEIDILQTRISYLTQACKLVGVYDQSNEGIKRIMNEGIENDLIPVANWGQFSEKGGLKGVVEWVPLEDVVNAINILSQKQAEKIQQLYQVTGMSDIMRGASQPYEAAATSKAKVEFASIRVQALQEEFARFASDLQNLKLEIIQKHYQDYCIIQQSNAEALYDQELVQPALELLRDRDKFRWKVTIRPESLAMADYAQLKADRTDYLNGIATFTQSSAPLAQLDKKIVPVLLKLMQWGLAGFKGSNEIEGVLDKAIDMYQKIAEQPPEPPPPDPKVQAMQMEMQMKQEEHQAKMQSDQMKYQAEFQEMQQKFALEIQKMQQEMRQDQQKFMLEMKALMMKLQFAREKAQIETEAERQDQAAQFAFNTAERQDEMQANREDRSHAAAVQMVSDSEKAKTAERISRSRGNGQSPDSDA